MATPITVVAGVTEWSAAEANKFISADGSVLSAKMWWARVFYNGVNSVVDSGTSSSGLVTASVAFAGGNTAWVLTLSGFVNPPVVTCMPLGAAAYYGKITSTISTQVEIGFYDIDTGAKIVTGVEDINMDLNIMIIGD